MTYSAVATGGKNGSSSLPIPKVTVSALQEALQEASAQDRRVMERGSTEPPIYVDTPPSGSQSTRL